MKPRLRVKPTEDAPVEIPLENDKNCQGEHCDLRLSVQSVELREAAQLRWEGATKLIRVEVSERVTKYI